ncbi:undecaprenyldiphospho-muramoylpentapeptide beta-N-acetylglucosaminyltransferase [Desulfobaculum xiamenense]|nr:undecaprenyldiphospho-muramoylpentapeptide beta-N-acetylglucosaminyltransferase [Desulfobaculum xiamenense]
MKRVILTTGGTGGHIFPALAVAEELKRRHPDIRILFVGGRYGREADFAAEAGLEFVGLPVRGVLGRGLKAVSALFGMARAVVQAIGIIGSFAPDAVVGFGGYASFAPVLAARLRGVPCAVHEQNSVPGASNRLLAKLAKRVFLSFPDTHKAFSAAKCILTGNPVRDLIRKMADEPFVQRTTRHLLVVGGSLGARALNDAVIANISGLRDAGFELRHQTGEADLARVKTAYTNAGVDTETSVAPFIRDMKDAYRWADIVLCRSGATTVAELAVAGKPSVLVPFPYATHDHQTVNARFLADSGAAIIVPQAELAGKDLTQLITDILSEPGRLARMADAARALGAPNAAAKLAEGIENMTNA